MEIKDEIYAQIMNLTDDGNGEIVPEVYQFTINNFPNPFNPETTLAFTIPTEGHVRIDVYNIRGQRVRTVVNEHLSIGHHTAIWNGKDEIGRDVSSGVYLYRIRTVDNTATGKMLLLK
jgi:hypothetical protein